MYKRVFILSKSVVSQEVSSIMRHTGKTSPRTKVRRGAVTSQRSCCGKFHVDRHVVDVCLYVCVCMCVEAWTAHRNIVPSHPPLPPSPMLHLQQSPLQTTHKVNYSHQTSTSQSCCRASNRLRRRRHRAPIPGNPTCRRQHRHLL